MAEHAWELPPTIAWQELETKLRDVSARITGILRAHWQDPPDLTFEARLPGAETGRDYMQRLNSYLIAWDARDGSGMGYHGAGLLWFVTFVVELLYVASQRRPMLLLFDEPATPLHPAAQRAVARVLDGLSAQHQVIYSTHSPFMIDWSFPQRVRLFVRDYASKRSFVQNKPFHESADGMPWDPLRDTIGVTLGDMVVIGDENILVEGVTDQIILANASVRLRALGRAHVDLNRTSIVPYDDEHALRYIIAKARGRASKAIVLADGDEQGRRIAALCRREGMQCVMVGTFSDRPGCDAAIEDVLGVETYVMAVNSFYERFSWFRRLNPAEIRASIGSRSLTKHIDVVFREQFGKALGKVEMATYIASVVESLPDDVMTRLEVLIRSLTRGSANYQD